MASTSVFVNDEQSRLDWPQGVVSLDPALDETEVGDAALFVEVPIDPQAGHSSRFDPCPGPTVQFVSRGLFETGDEVVPGGVGVGVTFEEEADSVAEGSLAENIF